MNYNANKSISTELTYRLHGEKGHKAMAYKEYAVTPLPDDSNLYMVHKYVGGGGYIGVFTGTYNEVVQYLKNNGIADYTTGN